MPDEPTTTDRLELIEPPDPAPALAVIDLAIAATGQRLEALRGLRKFAEIILPVLGTAADNGASLPERSDPASTPGPEAAPPEPRPGPDPAPDDSPPEGESPAVPPPGGNRKAERDARLERVTLGGLAVRLKRAEHLVAPVLAAMVRRDPPALERYQPTGSAKPMFKVAGP